MVSPLPMEAAATLRCLCRAFSSGELGSVEGSVDSSAGAVGLMLASGRA